MYEPTISQIYTVRILNISLVITPNNDLVTRCTKGRRALYVPTTPHIRTSVPAPKMVRAQIFYKSVIIHISDHSQSLSRTNMVYKPKTPYIQRNQPLY